MRNSLGSKVIRNCWRRWHGFGGRTRLCLERENRPDQRCVYVDKRGQNDSGLNIATCDDLWAWQMMALEKHLDALRSENTSLKERIVSQGHKLMEVEGELQKRDSMDVHRTVSDRKWLSTRAEIVNIMNHLRLISYVVFLCPRSSSWNLRGMRCWTTLRIPWIRPLTSADRYAMHHWARRGLVHLPSLNP